MDVDTLFYNDGWSEDYASALWEPTNGTLFNDLFTAAPDCEADWSIFADSNGSSTDSSFEADEPSPAPAPAPAATVLTPLSEEPVGVDPADAMQLDATHLQQLKQHARFFALETLAANEPVRPQDVFESPALTLILLPYLDAASCVSLSVVSRGFRARYGPLLTKVAEARYSVCIHFGRAVVAHGLWNVGREFPRLFLKTVNPSMLYYAGIRGHLDAAYNIFVDIASVTVELACLRALVCGTVCGGHMVQARAVANHLAATLRPEDAKAVLDWPMDSISHGYAQNAAERARGTVHGARTFVDFLVSQSFIDMAFVLELVGRGLVHMTTFATRKVVALTRPSPPPQTTAVAPVDTDMCFNLIGNYLQILAEKVNAVCAACDMTRLAFMWENHDKDLAAHLFKKHHKDFIAAAATSRVPTITRADRVRVVAAILTYCGSYDGGFVAQTALRLKSLRLFEMAFDTVHAVPSAAATYTDSQRIELLLSIAQGDGCPPIVATPAPPPPPPQPQAQPLVVRAPPPPAQPQPLAWHTTGATPRATKKSAVFGVSGRKPPTAYQKGTLPNFELKSTRQRKIVTSERMQEFLARRQ